MLLILLKITTFLTTIFSLILGLYTLKRNPKSQVHWLWFLTCLSVVIWSVGYLLGFFAKESNLAFIYLKIVYFGAILIPILYFHFLNIFLLKRKNQLLIIGYVLAFIFIILVLATNYLVAGVKYLEHFGYYEQINFPLFYLYLAYYLFYVIFSLSLLIKSYKTLEGIKKKQLIYLIWATIIGFGGGTTNFIMALTGIYPIGQLFVFLFYVLVTYGIFLKKY